MTSALDPVRLLTDSLKIYSPTSEESDFAKFLLDRMEGLGYSKVRADSAGNAIGEIGRGKTTLLLCGHMDTVPGRLPVKKDRSKVYGRGAADAKSPLCALLLAGAAAADTGVRVTFTGVTQEEGEGQGIERLMKSPTKYDYAVFGEPSGAHKVTIGYRGRASVQVVVKTAGGHAGSAWAHRSAFDGFSDFLSKIRAYEQSKAVEGNYFRSISITPTMVRAGEFHNVVPGLCEATLDLRVPPQTKVADAVKDIAALADGPDDGTAIEVHPGAATEAYEADPNSTLVRAFQRAILLRLQTKPALVRKTGTGDMNTFAHRRQIQCVTYGPGDSLTSHTDSEEVGIQDYLRSIEVLKEAIVQLATLDSRSHK